MALFRKAAVDKLASPERLDELMKVTSPLGWLAMLTTGIVLAGAVIWGIFGSIPNRVAGSGILAAGSYVTVDANAKGELVDFDLEVGQYVQPGELVARIDQPDLEERKRTAGDRYQSFLRDYNNGRITHDANADGWRDTISRQRGQIDTFENNLAAETEKLGDPKYAQNTIRNNIDQINMRIDGAKDKIERAEESIRRSGQSLATLRRQMESAQGEFEALESQRDHYSKVFSNTGGKVLDIDKSWGDEVRPGDRIVRLLQGNAEGLQAKFFIGSAQGAEIREGMVVEVSPSTIKKEEYGFLKGEVTERSLDTLPQSQLLRELSDEQRVRKINEMGPVYMIRAKLMPCETPTEFCWSSGSGPPGGALDDNMKIDVNVVTRERAPISYIVPKIKEAFGAS